MHIETLPRRKHGISLTPLIDVVFILLLFFMLATSFTDWRQISLATGTTASADQGPPPAVVRVAADGGLHYDGDSYSAHSLIPVLLQRQKAGDLAAVIVRPAPDTELGPTVAALDALANTGLPVALSRPPTSGETASP